MLLYWVQVVSFLYYLFWSVHCSLLFPVVPFDSDCLPFFRCTIGSLGVRASVTCHPGCHPMCWQGCLTHLSRAHMRLCTCLYFLWTLVCSLAPSPKLPGAHLTYFVVYWWGITVPLRPDWLAAVRGLGRQSDSCPTFLVADLRSAYPSVCSKGVAGSRRNTTGQFFLN